MDGPMPSSIKDLKGSPSRDRFKYLHKQMLPKTAWACDLDLVLIAKTPDAFIPAILDAKMPGDDLTFAEAIGYASILRMEAPFRPPIFLIWLLHFANHFEFKDVSEGDFEVIEIESDPANHR